jgi:hypothetical protein
MASGEQAEGTEPWGVGPPRQPKNESKGRGILDRLAPRADELLWKKLNLDRATLNDLDQNGATGDGHRKRGSSGAKSSWRKRKTA